MGTERQYHKDCYTVNAPLPKGLYSPEAGCQWQYRASQRWLARHAARHGARLVHDRVV